MTRMKMEIKEPKPFSSIMKKTNELEAFTRFREHHPSLEPTDAHLNALIRLEYPIIYNVIPMVKCCLVSDQKLIIIECSHKYSQSIKSYNFSDLQTRGRKMKTQIENVAGFFYLN